MKIENIPRTISLNRYRNCHHFELDRLKKEHADDVEIAIEKMERIKTPAIAIFTFHSQNKKHVRDIDGQIISVKFCLDALVGLGLLWNDTPEFITEIVLRTGDKKANVYDVIFLPAK